MDIDKTCCQAKLLRKMLAGSVKEALAVSFFMVQQLKIDTID
jgi:hypothetical protein